MLADRSRIVWWAPAALLSALSLSLLLPSLALSGCATQVRGAGAAAPTAGLDEPSAAFTSVAPIFVADAAPITALAWDDPFLWIGSARGLRRVRFPAVEAEWIGGAAGFPGRSVTALAAARPGRLLIASELGIGELSFLDGRAHYRAVVALPNVTQLASVAAAGGHDRFWVGTTAGLFSVEDGKTSALEAVGRVAITSLDLDAAGGTAWVGARGRGLFHVDARQVLATVGPGDPDGSDLVDVVGTAAFPNGTRIAAGRGADGGARLVVLRLGAPVVLTAQPNLSLDAVVTGPQGPVLISGTGSSSRAYALAFVERGEAVADGSLRFVPGHKSLQGIRLVAQPLGPPGTLGDATVAVGAGDDVYVGTLSSGVAHLEPRALEHLPAGELVIGARALSVACRDADHCLFASGTGTGWSWNGRDAALTPIPTQAVGGALTAVVADKTGAAYLIGADGKKTVRIVRSNDHGGWDPVLNLPLATEGAPLITFATMSPDGNLWMAVRDRTADGRESGIGVIEVELPAARAIHHRAYVAGEARPADALPIVGDVRAVRFQAASDAAAGARAIWFCTSSGVLRFAAGDLSHWGENEGLASESCRDLALGLDGIVWAATEEGVARFDGKLWRDWDGGGSATGAAAPAATATATATATAHRWPVDREGDPLAARALVVTVGGVWAGTARGVWPVTASGRPIDKAAGLVDDDITGLESDRFGRLWLLGHAGLSIRALPR